MLPSGFCPDPFFSFIIPHQSHTGNHDIAAHKYKQSPGYDLSNLLWNPFNPFFQRWIQPFKPYYCSNPPEETVKKIDSATQIKWDIAVIPKDFPEKNLCKYTTQILIRTTKQCPYKK